MLVSASVPGKSSLEIDAIAEEFLRDHGAVPLFKNYQPVSNIPPYPGSICFSKNSVLVHGVPSEQDIIQEGDVITVDCGLRLRGWCADAARLFGVGKVSEEDRSMLGASERILQAGIDTCVVGNKLSDICHALQRQAEREHPFFNVLEFCGHAIGKEMHEAPQIPNFGLPGKGPDLAPGMVFCLEPMLKKTSTGLGVLPDQWTIATHDGSTTTHVEHMVVVTEHSPEILTL
jgi:methionyl aminopeptidase